jgi:hypothetical protein
MDAKERDQQKWMPVLRPGALQLQEAQDLVAKPHTLWRILRAAPPAHRGAGLPLNPWSVP